MRRRFSDAVGVWQGLLQGAYANSSSITCTEVPCSDGSSRDGRKACFAIRPDRSGARSFVADKGL